MVTIDSGSVKEKDFSYRIAFYIWVLSHLNNSDFVLEREGLSANLEHLRVSKTAFLEPSSSLVVQNLSK